LKQFVDLYIALDETNKTTGKVDAMVRYFQTAPPEDAVWGLYFLTGRRPKRPVSVTKLWAWANELSGLPEWLFSESYDAVGDLAETIATILPDTRSEAVSPPLHLWIDQRLLPMQGMAEADQRVIVEQAWRELDRNGRFVWNKLITGGFRVGVSQDLVIRALSKASGIPVPKALWERTAATRTRVSLIRFASLTHGKARFPHWATSRPGQRNGSGTGSVLKLCGGVAIPLCGPAAKN